MWVSLCVSMKVVYVCRIAEVHTYRTCAATSSGKAGQYRCCWRRRWKLLHHPGTHLEHHPLLPGNYTFFFLTHTFIWNLFLHSYLYREFPSSHLFSPPLLFLHSEVKCNNKVSASQPVHFPFTEVHQSAARLVDYVIHTAVQCFGQTPWGNNYLYSALRLSLSFWRLSTVRSCLNWQVWAGVNANDEQRTLSFFDGLSLDHLHCWWWF